MFKYLVGVTIYSIFVLSPSAHLLAQDNPQMNLIAGSNGCFECHGSARNGIGPSFKNIAKRYIADDQARANLFSIIKNGGKGNWTEMSKGVPMPPYSGSLSDENIRGLVDWVLSSQ